MKYDTVDASTTSTFRNASLQQQRFEHILSLNWQQQHHHDSSSNSSNKDQQDTHVDEKTHISTYKATQYFVPKQSNKTMLEHYRACLTTIELRNQWCPWLTDIHVIESKKERHKTMTSLKGKIIDEETGEHDMSWLEQTSLTKHSVRFIAATASLDFFLAIEIQDGYDPNTTTTTTTARATIYLQWIKPTLITPLVTLNRLTRLDPFPWISQCDQAITLKKVDYDNDNKCYIEFSYQQQQPVDLTSLPQAVDIRQKMNHPATSKWRHSGSWDPQQQQQQQQTVRKNKFLGSSSLIFASSSSSAASSPQLRPMAGNFSYPDKQHHHMIPWLTVDDDDDDELDGDENQRKLHALDKDGLRVQVAYIPQITLVLPEKLEWSDKFAQLCVRCYRRRVPASLKQQQEQQQHDSYVIQILHPQHMMQYFVQEEEQEESMRLDDEDENAWMDPLLVSVTISKSNSQKFRVNQNEFPIRSWTMTSEEEEEDANEEKEGQDQDDDDDIFVDGMEELTQESNVTNNMQAIASLPSSSTLIQTVAPLQDMSPEKTVYSEKSATPAMQHPLTVKKMSIASVQEKKKEQTLTNSNKVEALQEEQDIDLDEYRSLENKIPLSDPAALQKAAPQFNAYLQPSNTTTIVQSPCKENGQVMIKKIDIPNHPLGGFLSESTWKDCSIWDIKSVLESTGARRIWDNTFDNSTCLHALTPTSSLWHIKMKGTWPVSARDYVCFQGQYTSPYRIDLLTTSCFGDSFQYKPLPQPVTGYTRATMDVMGWRLERMDEKTASVKQVMVTQFPTWVIQYITSRFIVQTCAAVQSARQYFETFGAPPSLEHLICAQLVNVKHDHERKNWRCEYTRRLGASSSDKEAQQESATDSGNSLQQSTISVVRLDKRRWAANNSYTVAIDPPPSRVSALQKVSDPYGVWLTVEHDEAFIIPLRGKILVLIKPADELPVKHSQQPSECTLNVNGNTITVDREQRKPSIPTAMPDRNKQSSFSHNFLQEEEQAILSKILSSDDSKVLPVQPASVPSTATTVVATEKYSSSPATTMVTEEAAKIEQALNQLPVSPKEHAQAALSFLKLTDEQFGWTVLSDNNKSGIRISKKPGVKNIASSSSSSSSSKNEDKSAETATTTITNNNALLQVFDPYMVYKGSKVIENFSMDDIRSVITDIGHIRALYDDTIEPKTDLIRQDDASGCRVIRQTIKALFPFKNREIYAVSCVAQEELLTSMSNTKRTLYVESSLPDFPLINSKKTRGHLFMSGWILEPIDPYNTTTATNHPIPSTRVIYVAALDLGVSVPSYISNLVANNWFPKKLQAVESYLKSKGPPPVITLPFPLLVFSNNTLSKSSSSSSSSSSSVQDNNVEWICIKSSYDEKHQFKVTNRFKILTEQKKPRLEEALQPTASSSASLVPPFRRPSHHTLTPETRRGSLPTTTLPKKRNAASTATTTTAAPAPAPAVTVPSISTTTASSTAVTHASNSVTYRALPCLQTTFDLRPYTKGYEIQAQLYQTTLNTRKNISNKLELSISEPPLSNLLDGNKKNMKHTVTIQVVQGVSAANEYELEFTLVPVREESLNKRPTQLTVSHVLGEDQTDDGSWHGIIMVNDVEASVNSEIKLKALHHDDEKLESASHSHLSSPGEKNIHGDTGSADSNLISRDVHSTTDGSEVVSGTGEPSSYFEKTSNVPHQDDYSTQYVGSSGVVATALGNVSAGVNNFGARMMNPFRAASSSFLLPNNLNNALESTTEDVSSSDEGDDSSGPGRHGSKRRFTREERSNINSTTMTMHEIRLLRKSSDTMRKGMLLLMICLGLAVVFALLMLQPMLERYYASFTVSSTVASLNQSIEEGVVRRLMQIPWFGGWDIQVIAVRRA